ncbi:hypothetical protein ABK040_011709 [Willaertia magna]
MKQDSIHHTFPDTNLSSLIPSTFLNNSFQEKFLKHKKEVSRVEILKNWHLSEENGDSKNNEIEFKEMLQDIIYQRNTLAILDKINAPSILGIKKVEVYLIEKLILTSDRKKCIIDFEIQLQGDIAMKEHFYVSCQFEFEEKNHTKNEEININNNNEFPYYVDLKINMKVEFKKSIWGITELIENALISNENKLFCKWIEMSYDVIPVQILPLPSNTNVISSPNVLTSTEMPSNIISEIDVPLHGEKKKSKLFTSLRTLLRKKKKEGKQSTMEQHAHVFIKHVGYEETIKREMEKRKEQQQKSSQQPVVVSTVEGKEEVIQQPVVVEEEDTLFSPIAKKQESSYYIMLFGMVGLLMIGLLVVLGKLVL